MRSTSIDPRYQQPMWGTVDPVLRRCLTASTVTGVLAIIVILLAPALPERPKTIATVPERIARLIVEKPKPVPAAKTPERVATAEPPKAAAEEKPAEPPPQPKAAPRRAPTEPQVAQNRGTQGRQRAQQEVTKTVAQVTGSLDKVMADISKALPASTSDAPASNSARARRARGVRAGRSSEQLGSVGGVSSMASADVAGSAIDNQGISIAAITNLAVESGSGGGGSGSGGGGSPEGTAGATGSASSYRSNESLLSVVRRYAPGIQFCYDNELKKNAGLRGKLVIAITVLASGEVSDASVVENTLGSQAVASCVLAQVRGWRFPAIPHGVTSFRAPFVFTPPS
ncbi:MAG TPA: TonB family protein [Candidatus Krumholzibacteria bacterium]|nr:TonB family protein [Candidatus Krumholzibacteria bacterium]